MTSPTHTSAARRESGFVLVAVLVLVGVIGMISATYLRNVILSSGNSPVSRPAIDAAEAVHSDMKKGFIRAEVLAYDDLMAAGSYAEARKKGTVRLEGKTYEVKDGDIINFRFNV